MKSKNITVTQGRLQSNFDNVINNVIDQRGIEQKIINTVEESKTKIGIMTKFYPYLDKCEVQLKKKKVLCRILHRYAGDLIDFYTPNGEPSYCNKLKEPCILPRGELECLVLDINNNDTSEWLFLGYCNSEEFISINPAEQGNLKIANISGNNEYWIKFGYDGLDVRLEKEPDFSLGEFDEEMEDKKIVNDDDASEKSYNNGVLIF